MTSALRRWVAETSRRRGEHLAGEDFSPGLLADARFDPAACRRAAATTLVTLVGGRSASVTFDGGASYAIEGGTRVNIDGDLVDPGVHGPPDVDELVAGVAAHEGGHVLLSAAPGQRPTPLRRWLYNLVEDERVEVQVARRWPALSAPIATTRQALIRFDPAHGSFLHALFYLVRAPHLLPADLWSARARLLARAVRILTPFPETPGDVARAVQRLTRLVPRDERCRVPPFPCLNLREGIGGRRAGERDAGRGLFARRSTEGASERRPAVLWIDVPPDPAGYAAVSPAVQADARILRAAFLAASRPRPLPAARHGTLDRRRLAAWRCDDHLFRAPRRVTREVMVVLLLDISGSMRDSLAFLQRIAVTVSEAVRGLPHVRLYVYGHAADGEGFPRTEIFRFATPARGPVLSLGSFPHGANNRDGHALELIARDLTRLEPCRRRTRVAFHACDGDPSASGYGGLPAREATREAIGAFRHSFGPLVLLGVGHGPALTTLGAPVVPCHQGRFGQDLLPVLGAILSA